MVTTSTRPDTLAVTHAARAQGRPGARVRPATPRRRDPRRDGLVPDPRLPPPADRDDPRPRPGRRHRDDPHPGRRGLLGRPNRNRPTRAAARRRPGRAPPAALYRWSLDPAAATDAVSILTREGAAPGWDDALDAALHADPRTRDSIWLGVRQALGALADPRVLAAVTPTDEQAFDPAAFLAEHGTLFLLGTAAGAGAAASLVAALVEDIVETARHTAAAAPRARLDPPLLLALDEIGTLAPLPSLPALMSDGGGSGITTLAVLQSLSQARDKWGEQQAGTLWDAAIVKLILGGGSHARDLADLSALIGERDEPTHTIARDATGTRSSSTSTRRVPVLDPSRLRTLPFGTGGPAAAHRPTDRAEPAPVDHPGRRARTDPSPSRRRNPAAHHRRNRTPPMTHSCAPPPGAPGRPSRVAGGSARTGTHAVSTPKIGSPIRPQACRPTATPSPPPADADHDPTATTSKEPADDPHHRRGHDRPGSRPRRRRPRLPDRRAHRDPPPARGGPRVIRRLVRTGRTRPAARGHRPAARPRRRHPGGAAGRRPHRPAEPACSPRPSRPASSPSRWRSGTSTPRSCCSPGPPTTTRPAAPECIAPTSPPPPGSPPAP